MIDALNIQPGARGADARTIYLPSSEESLPGLLPVAVKPPRRRPNASSHRCSGSQSSVGSITMCEKHRNRS